MTTMAASNSNTRETMVDNAFDARAWAEQAALERLLNAYMRETGNFTPAVPIHEAEGKPHLTDLKQAIAHTSRTGAQAFRLALPNTMRTLWGVMSYWSPFGHHRYGNAFWLEQRDGMLRRLHDALELADVLLQELAAGDEDDIRGWQRAHLMRINIANSIEKTTLYLMCGERQADAQRNLWSLHGEERFAAAEQSLLLGHPFHPTPKSSEGFSQEDLHAFAPELRASFQLHYFAAAPELVQEGYLPTHDAGILPAEVTRVAQAALAPHQRAYRLLPCHPWQANYLRGIAEVKELLAQGLLLDLGALGNQVYPTSSVRTVWDPQHDFFFKLPLNVRITHFIRVNPLEQLERTLDASRVLSQIAPQLPDQRFRILFEAGYRTLRLGDAPPEVSEALAASWGVIFRENPAGRPVDDKAPLVVASLLEQHPWAELPPLLPAVHSAAAAQGVPADSEFLKKWLRQYLDISLQPLMWLFTHYGVSIEAHVQNSMVALDQGWPVQFCVRDLEGVSISRSHVERLEQRGISISPHSPALFTEAEAWQRLQYYFFVNHVGHLIHTLGYHSGVDERELWKVVAEMLPNTEFLREGMPAKANLTSSFQKRGETPSYVLVPNPLTNRGVLQ